MTYLRSLLRRWRQWQIDLCPMRRFWQVLMSVVVNFLDSIKVLKSNAYILGDILTNTMDAYGDRTFCSHFFKNWATESTNAFSLFSMSFGMALIFIIFGGILSRSLAISDFFFPLAGPKSIIISPSSSRRQRTMPGQRHPNAASSSTVIPLPSALLDPSTDDFTEANDNVVEDTRASRNAKSTFMALNLSNSWMMVVGHVFASLCFDEVAALLGDDCVGDLLRLGGMFKNCSQRTWRSWVEPQSLTFLNLLAEVEHQRPSSSQRKVGPKIVHTRPPFIFALCCCDRIRDDDRDDLQYVPLNFIQYFPPKIVALLFNSYTFMLPCGARAWELLRLPLGKKLGTCLAPKASFSWIPWKCQAGPIDVNCEKDKRDIILKPPLGQLEWSPSIPSYISLKVHFHWRLGDFLLQRHSQTPC